MKQDIASKVLAILNPPARKRPDGTMVSADAYYNLEGAIQDLRNQKADRVCIRTIERVQEQILRAVNLCKDEHVRSKKA